MKGLIHYLQQPGQTGPRLYVRNGKSDAVSHGIGYEEYGRRLETRMKVERQRELDYEKSKRISAGAY